MHLTLLQRLNQLKNQLKDPLQQPNQKELFLKDLKHQQKLQKRMPQNQLRQTHNLQQQFKQH